MMSSASHSPPHGKVARWKHILTALTNESLQLKTETVQVLDFRRIPEEVGTIEGIDPKLRCKAVPGSIRLSNGSSGVCKHWSRRHPVLIYEAGLKIINIGARTTD
jgi:hypothetical protein